MMWFAVQCWQPWSLAAAVAVSCVAVVFAAAECYVVVAVVVSCVALLMMLVVCCDC